jgi:curli biogenesis system outer membrane secretion channel CsgG
MKKLFLLLVISAWACSSALAADNSVAKETKGQGASRDEAIKNALYQAVAQARGVKVGTGEYSFGFDSASAGIDRQGTKRQVDFDAVSVQTGGTLTTTQAEGLVKTYEVMEEKKTDDGKYEVRLKVWVYDYQPLDKTSRPKLAVMPIKAESPVFPFGPLETSAAELSQQLSHKLSVGLTETNKFAVLDREYILDFAHERNILLSDDTSLEEKAKLGEVLGADYMLVGTISDARLEIKNRESASQAIGHKSDEYKAYFVFNYRVIGGPTRQVKLADSVNISLETEEVMKLVKRWEPKNLEFRELRDNLVSKVANQAVETIIDRLYPIRIATISPDGQVVINQGGRRMLEGSLLDVFVEGKDIIDSDTKESIGKAETLVATLKIEKVAPIISYTAVAAGDSSKLSEGMVCRPKKMQENAQPGSKSQIERTPQGGVKLPFEQ